MSKRSKETAVSYPSSYTVLSNSMTLTLKRGTDGEYLLIDENSGNVIYLGDAQAARRVQVALCELLDANDEE